MTFSRRDFLKTSGVAASALALGWHRLVDAGNRLYARDDAAAMGDVGQPVPTVLAAWAGDALQSSVLVSALTDGFKAVGIAVSVNANMDAATFYPPSKPDATGWNRFTLTGLAPGTLYHWQVTDSPTGHGAERIGAVSHVRTLRPVGLACTTRIAVGSCKQPTPSSTAAWDDIAAWRPDRVMDLGDFGYPNDLTTDVATHIQNWTVNAQDAGRKKVQALCAVDYIASDHDTNDSAQSSSNPPNYKDPVTSANLAAWQQVVPARMEDTQSPKHGRWRAEVEGNVRFIKLDTRSLDRSDNVRKPTDPRSPTSTMLGATQLAWWKGQIRAAAAARQLVVMFSDPDWNGVSPGPPIPRTYSDKWPSYIYERDLMSDFAASLLGPNLFIAYGDSHILQQDDGTNEKNGFASICCGPFHQNLHAHFQNSVQWNYPDGVAQAEGKNRNAMQYQRLTITQRPGSSTVTVTAEARDCTPKVSGTPLTVRTMTKTYTL
ncbi:MAG: alkaline phosphatase D family protein [Nocardioidaceae bacterium]